MQELPFLINISAALIAAFLSGLIARRLRLPTIIGYLLAGVIIGPFTPGFVGDSATINQLADLGIIFLMFGVGLSISFKDLWGVKDVAIPGSLAQLVILCILGFGLSRIWGWSPGAGILLGLAISNASSVVMLRGLMDNSLLNTRHGKVAISWSVVQDLATVFILVMLPAFGGGQMDWRAMGLAGLKAAGFVLAVVFIGTRFIPWLLHLIVHTRSRELFILAVLAISLGMAFSSASFFGVSLALGAFVAGVVIAESPLSYQVGADILPFREAFAALFFVSIGMLFNPDYVLNHVSELIVLTALIVLGKALVITIMGFVFHHPARTMLVTAISNSQIGEFSFILGQGGLTIGLLSRDQYSLILAAALFSITLNPLAFKLLEPLENSLHRFPKLWNLLDRHGPALAAIEESIDQHVVVIGYGRLGRHVVNVLEAIGVPHLVIEADAQRVEELNRQGTMTLFGDAANSEVITHARLDHARSLVVTMPEEASNEMVVAAARDIAPDLQIIVRAATEEGVKRLASLGVNDVIHPELEGSLEIVRHTLLRLGLPLKEINSYTDAVRQDHYDLLGDRETEHRRLHRLLSAVEEIEIVWFELPDGHALCGQTLSEANLRARTGASIVAILRDRKIIANPKSGTRFETGDQIGVIGESEQIELFRQLIGVESL